MIELDGSYGAGGGQIVRTALALSAMTGKPFHLFNIRAKRAKPGLAAQHLTGVKAVAALCNAKLKGAELGSKELWFEPGKIRAKELRLNVGTAGSIALVLQALMPALTQLEQPIELEIIGGTDVKMAPPMDYIDKVLLALLAKLNYKASLTIERRGFFPRGGGKVRFRAEPMRLKRYDWLELGKLKKLYGFSVAAEQLKQRKVAERQLEAAKEILAQLKLPVQFQIQYAASYSAGSVITLWLESEHSVLGASALGELKKSAEQVGKEAALNLLDELRKDAVVDRYASDQLLPYIALTGGSLKTSCITEHARTNAFVIEHFLPVKFSFDEKAKIIKVERCS